MPGIILVPMAASAIRNDDLRHVVPASVDLARLPWSDGQHDHNANQPYLSLSVLNPPFASDHFALQSGTHLHWQLPGIYRRGFLDRSERSHVYCPVPNFWLVRRIHGNKDTAWVVESDVLMQPSYFRHASGSVMPFSGKTGTPPFRLIGRMMPLEGWQEQTVTPARYPALTAMGYGDGTFASYYPACARCFGFHDQDASHSNDEVIYEVLGWRREPDQNLLPWLTTTTLIGQQNSLRDLFNEQLFTQQEGKARKTALGWKLISVNGLDAQAQPSSNDLVLCYTRMTMAGSSSQQTGHPIPSGSVGNNAVSIGNNAVNAITAHVVEEMVENQPSLERRNLEEQLDHVAVDAALLGGKSDRYFKLLEQRHQESFVGVPGGIRWSLHSEHHGGKADAERSRKRAAHTTPQKFNTQLSEINRLQAKHNQAMDRLNDLQEQLFSEWNHYQLAMYPATLHSGIHQNADEIRHYIEHQTLPRVEQLQSEIDRLAFKFARDHTLTNVELRDRPALQNENGITTEPTDRDRRSADAHSVEELSASLNTLLAELSLYNRSLICGRLHGDIAFGYARSVQHYLDFHGGDEYVQLDHIDGMRGAVLHKGEPLSEFALSFRFRANPGEGGVVLSFDTAAWFEIEVPIGGSAQGKLVFTAIDPLGEIHRLESHKSMTTGRWQRVLIHFGRGTLSIQIDAKVEVFETVWQIGGRSSRQGYLGAATTTVPYTQEQTVIPGFRGALTGLRMVIGPVEKERLNGLVDTQDRPHLTLRQTAATRYWQPREPAVAVVGDAAQNSDPRLTERHYPHDPLRCIHLEEFPTDLLDIDSKNVRHKLHDRFRDLMAIVDKAQPDPHSFGYNHSSGDSWQPMLAEWEVGLYPLAVNDLHNGLSNHYAPDFIERAYELDRESVDLTVRPAGRPLAKRESFLTGRTVISPNHADALHDQLEEFIKARGGDAKVPPELPQMLQLLSAERGRTITFPLEGFVAAMLKKLQILQLPVDDPLAFDDYRPFTERVRRAVGDQRTLSPDPSFDFNPIQSGAMELQKLRLIDNFGQHRDLQLDKVRRVSNLRADDHSNLITLPARLAQPARLEFRWLEATSHKADASGHANSSPICGWLTVNDLDGLIAIHDASGHPLGALVPDSDVMWQPLPGMERAIAPAQFRNPMTRKLVEWLVRQGGSFIDLFARVLDRSLDSIHPENFGADEWALMSGRPLAIVQVKLALRLKGLPAIDQGFGALYQTLATGQQHNADYEAVRFPVRLGDHRQVNDGLVGYWFQDEAGGLDGAFHVPNAGAIDAVRQAAGLPDNLPGSRGLPISGGDSPPLIPLAINHPERILTLIVDPRGHLQATSGILPAKALTLPETFYLNALARMRPAFFTAPVLTPSDKLTLPLPRHNGLQWDWLERRREAWVRIDQAAIGEPNQVAAAGGGQEIREGWLELNSRDEPHP